MIYVLYILLYHPNSEARPNSKITGAYCAYHLRILDLESQRFGSQIRIRIEEFKYFSPKNCYPRTEDLVNMIRNIHPGS